MKHNGGRVRKLLPKLLLIILGFLLGAVIAEIALRATGYSYPEFYELEQTRGYGLRPSAEGWYRKEGRSYVRINSDGLRDQEYLIEKPANTLRAPSSRSVRIPISRARMRKTDEETLS